MKIAYIIDWDINSNSGVLNKITSKIQIWEKEGKEVFLFIVSHNTKTEFIPANIKNVVVVERPAMKFLLFKKLRAYFGRSAAFRILTEKLRSAGIDLIYFRQSAMWYPSLNRMFESFPTVMEVNTDDINEKLITANAMNRKVYFYGRKEIIKRVSGAIGVTNEISSLYLNNGFKVKTISNGVLVTGQIEKYQKQEKPQIIFVGTPGMKWHGVEKIIHLAKKLPEFVFHIVGIQYADEQINGNIIFHGYLNTKELESLYEIIDVGIGTLSLYEKKMQEACPLKVREYLSKGIPVIIGYKDVDVDGQPFVLNIGNYVKNVEDHVKEIKSFVNYYYGERVEKGLIFPLIDLRVKELERLTFLDTIKNNFVK